MIESTRRALCQHVQVAGAELVFLRRYDHSFNHQKVDTRDMYQYSFIMSFVNQDFKTFLDTSITFFSKLGG